MTTESTSPQTTDHDVLVTLHHEGEINRPWLENQAIAIEQAILEQCPHAPGSSVTANFEENGFELDLTIVAPSKGAFYDRLDEVLKVVEEAASIDMGGMIDEMRSTYQGPAAPPHDPAVLEPA